MKRVISYKKFINRIVFTTTIIIGLLFLIYGYFIQSSSIKQNLKNETSLFIDLIFENLYTAMQKGATKSDLDQIIQNIEKKISHSSITIYKKQDDTKSEQIKNIFITKEADFFQKGSYIDFARPILYKAECISCHNTNQAGDIAAVIRLEFSIFDLNVSMKDILIMITILFFISIFVIFTVWYKYLHSAFIIPVQNLISQMGTISEYKDLKQEIKIDSNIKEIKKLESVFNIQNKKLRLAYEHLEHSSNIDTLTQIYNRKRFNEYINEELELVERYGYDLSIVLLDLNKFKQINDTYGHDVGDVVLVEFSKSISKNIRTSDKFFRLGGDEFILVLSHTNALQATQVIEQLKNVVKNYTFTYNEKEFSFSASFGMATYKEDGTTLQELLILADQRMYAEKNTLQ